MSSKPDLAIFNEDYDMSIVDAVTLIRRSLDLLDASYRSIGMFGRVCRRLHLALQAWASAI